MCFVHWSLLVIYWFIAKRVHMNCRKLHGKNKNQLLLSLSKNPKQEQAKQTRNLRELKHVGKLACRFHDYNE